METAWLVTDFVLCAVFLCLAFLLWGALRALGLLRWQLDQFQATTSRRVSRDGLPRGRRAPDFTLPAADGAPISVRDFAGRCVLLAEKVATGVSRRGFLGWVGQAALAAAGATAGVLAGPGQARAGNGGWLPGYVKRHCHGFTLCCSKYRPGCFACY